MIIYMVVVPRPEKATKDLFGYPMHACMPLTPYARNANSLFFSRPDRAYSRPV